jgi:ABC-type dipeptide/oligopeptide/nickel transport system permease subunit
MIATARRFILEQWWVPTIPGIAHLPWPRSPSTSSATASANALDPKQR